MNKDNRGFNVESLRLVSEAVPIGPNAGKKRRRWAYRTKRGELFLMGPIPWPWLCKASQCPGKALHVANKIWFLAYLTDSKTVGLNLSRLADEMGVSRDSARRGLRALESRKLVSVERHAGRKPIVTLLIEDTPTKQAAEDQ